MDDHQHKSRLFLFRLIPLLLVVSFVAWCSSDNKARKASEPVKAELNELFLSEGLIDSVRSTSSLADTARKMGQPAMNRLLYAAAPGASLDALKWIIQNGADPRNVGSIKDKTLLQQVAGVPRFERLEYFLGLGLDPLEQSRDGRNLLHLASEGGVDERVLSLLLSKGLPLAATTPTGANAMHFASVKSIPVLVKAGLAVDSTDAAQRTALHYAALAGKNELVAELLRSGASVFAQDKRGRTPLHLAALARSSPVTDTLLTAGAARTLRDADGNTARDLYQDLLRGKTRYDTRADLLDKL